MSVNIKWKCRNAGRTIRLDADHAATECATSGRLAREQPLLSQSSTVSRDASVAGETTEQRFLVSEDDVAATHVSCADNNIFHFSPSELTDGAAHDLLYT